MTATRRFGRFCLAATLVISSAAGSLVADPPNAPNLDSVLDDCSRLTLAATGRHIKDKTVTIGHLAITLADGTLIPVHGKSGSVLGAYFVGRGVYIYTTDSPADRDALAANAANVAGLLRPVNGWVNDTFKNALFLFSEPLFTGVYDADGTEESPSASMSAAFQSTLGGALNAYGEFEFRTAVARLNGEGKFVYVEFGGGLERVGYAFDDALEGIERMFAFRKLVDYDTRFSESISFQDLPGWTRDRRLSVVLKHADISIATTDNKSGSINSDLTFHVREPGTRLLSLGLLNNRDPDARSWRSPRLKLTVTRVVDTDGHDLAFSHKYNELVVEIPATTADADVRIRVETQGEVFVDMRGRHADNYFSLEGANWYPSPPGWAGQQFTYALAVKVKKPWRPVTSGRETMLKDDGQFVTAESQSDVPSMQIAVMAGKYFTHAETIDGLTVRVHSYGWNRKEVLLNMPKLAVAFVQFYGKMLGPIVLDELDIVEIPEYRFGVSPSGMVLITSEAYANVHSGDASGVNGRLAHELAHQWFGHRAIPVAPADNWLAESFAEYFSGIAMGALASKEKAIYGFDNMLDEWRAEEKLCSRGGTIATANYLGGFDGYRDRRCLLYDRGPLVLHMLRTSIGNDRFFAATKQFLDTANSGPATTDDYVRAVSETVQMDMSWFFDQWIRKSGNAQVEVEHHVDPAANGQFRLWGSIRQAPGPGFKQLLIPLVWNNNGKPEARVVFANQPETKFEFLLPTKPSAIKPDPFQNNLAAYK